MPEALTASRRFFVRPQGVTVSSSRPAHWQAVARNEGQKRRASLRGGEDDFLRPTAKNTAAAF
jgi:hypothetical protein